MVSAILYCACALVALRTAWTYGRGPAPLGYHVDILEKAGVPPHRTVSGLLLAQYRTLAAALTALSLAIAAIAVFGVAEGETWARFAAPICVLVFAGPVALIGRKAEMVTGVRTGWRQAAGVSALALTAFVLSWWT